MNWNFFNPLSDKFLNAEPETGRIQKEQAARNSVGFDAEWDAFVPKFEDPWEKQKRQDLIQQSGGRADPVFNGFSQVNFEPIFQNKKQKIEFYRSMSKFHSIGYALDIICDECIVKDQNDCFATLKFKPSFGNRLKRAEQYALQRQFDYLMRMVFRAGENNNLWRLFRRFMIEGELFLEKIPNKKGDRLIGFKRLPAIYTYPFYDNSILAGFFQVPPDEEEQYNNRTQYHVDNIPFRHDQVAYVNYGEYGRVLQDVEGYLESARRAFNQTRAMEDSMTILRLRTATEKRIWNIEMGRTLEPEQESKLKKAIEKYKKTVNYNPDSGLTQDYNVVSMNEDFFFAKSEGSGSSVELLNSSNQAQTFVDDLKIAYNVLYEALKIPPNRRLDSDGTATYVNNTEVVLHEMTFSKFNKRNSALFVRVIYDFFITQLRLQGFDKKYLNEANYIIELNHNNYFQEFREIQLATEKGNLIATYQPYTVSAEAIEGIKQGIKPLMSRKKLREKFFNMSPDEILEDDMQIDAEVSALMKKINAEGGESGGSEAAPADDVADLGF